MTYSSDIVLSIIGDIAPVFRGNQLFRHGSRQEIIGSLSDVFDRSDFVIGNLECPFTHQTSFGDAAGPKIHAPYDCFQGVVQLGLDAVTLANNHIMDSGVEGLHSTMRLCEESHLPFFGAGENMAEAIKPLYLSKGKKRIAVIGLAQHEFSIAGHDTPGAAGLDLIDVLDQLRRWDRSYPLVVLLHAGIEMYPLPSPYLQKVCRFIIDNGATAVVCQHSHVMGAYEAYHGGIIVYGQGNFSFDWKPHPGIEWSRGYVTQLVIQCNESPILRAIPYCQFFKEPGVRRLSVEDEQSCLRYLEDISDKIRDPGYVQSQWQAYCRAQRVDYYQLLRGSGIRDRVITELLGRLNISWEPFPKSHRRILGNLFRCEGHREVLETIFLNEEDSM